MHAHDQPHNPAGRADQPEIFRARRPVGGLMGEFAGWAYATAVAKRNQRYDMGLGIVRLDRPVVSIGNLSVGGTGKSPMVAWTLDRLIEMGRRPCVAMRGYRPRRVGTKRVSDEAEEYARRYAGRVPVVAQPKRVEGLQTLFATAEGSKVNAVVLDDGFQHRKIARACDIVLVDATRDPFNDRPLPAGWLREPVRALSRATAVVLTHAEAVSAEKLQELERRVAQVTGGPPIAVARHSWTTLNILEKGSSRSEPVSWLAGRRAFLACAIGNPGAMMSQARSHSTLVGAMLRRDHDPFKPKTVARIVSHAQRLGAAVILCTRKDWTKLSDTLPALWNGPIAVPELAMSFDRGEAELLAHVRSAMTRGV
jgi:tetraacyldisaccharide 4'-kinase